MAKKNKNANEKEEKKGAGSIIAIIIVLLIIILWIAIFAILVKLDVGGLGTTLRPTFKDVPIINSILPEVPSEVEAWENDYPFTKLSQSIEYIKQLEDEIESLKEANGTYPEQIADLNAEIARLKVFEDNVLEFEERVKRFDYMVVFNSKAPTLAEYDQLYHEINPTTAEEIHNIIARKMVYDDGIKQQADYLRSLKPAQAAAILTESTADIEWIVKVFKSMKESEAAAIINKMDALYAAKIFRKMEDMSKEEMENLMSEIGSYLGNQ